MRNITANDLKNLSKKTLGPTFFDSKCILVSNFGDNCLNRKIKNFLLNQIWFVWIMCSAENCVIWLNCYAKWLFPFLLQNPFNLYKFIAQLYVLKRSFNIFLNFQKNFVFLWKITMMKPVLMMTSKSSFICNQWCATSTMYLVSSWLIGLEVRNLWWKMLA